MTRPIIFLAYSLGGIAVKEVRLSSAFQIGFLNITRFQALVHSALSTLTPRIHDIISSTKAVFYLGTPHLGSDWSSWHAVILNMSKLYAFTNTRIVHNLARNSEYLTKLQEHYNTVSRGFETVSFCEEYPTSLLAGRAVLVSRNYTVRCIHKLSTSQLVGRDSAVPPGQTGATPVMLHKDHVQLVKFASADDDDFKTILSWLKHVLQDIQSVKHGVLGVEMQSK
jgi:hypothetical protein